MKNIVLSLLVVLATPAVDMSRQVSGSLNSAIINDQIGDASFREKKGKEITRLTRDKDLSRALYADQEVRCNKNCSLELLLCTGSKVTIKEKDGWYRIPALSCEGDKFIPGFSNHLQPGGRMATYIEDRQMIWDASDYRMSRNTAAGSRAGAIVGEKIGGTRAGVNSGNRVAAVGAEAGESRSVSMPRIPRSLSSAPDYYNKWFFRYPYEGARVIPELFLLDIIDTHTTTANQEKIRLDISMSAFSDEIPLKAVNEIRAELYFENGGFSKKDGQAFDPGEIRSFLREARKTQDRSLARIYCTVTWSGLAEAATGKLKTHTFGFEFYVMDSETEQKVLAQLEIANKETGIARYLGRAEVFESLGLFKLAINEYQKALELSPNSDVVLTKLGRLR